MVVSGWCDARPQSAWRHVAASPKDMTPQSASAETTRISGHTLGVIIVLVFVFVVRKGFIALVELFHVSQVGSVLGPRSKQTLIKAQCESAHSMKGEAPVVPIALTASRSISSGQNRAYV